MIVGDTIVHEVRYAHPIDAVWRAITEPTAIAAWLMANDFVAERGHRFHLDASPSYGVVDCEVVDVEPPTLLRCTWLLGGVASVVTIRLREDDGDTVLHLEHELAPQPVVFDDGWGDKMRQLGEVLAGERDPSESQPRPHDGLYAHPLPT